jgi:heterodisulfide reductase subunit E
VTEVVYYKPWILFWIAAILAHGYMDYAIWQLVKSSNRGQREPSRNGWTFQSVRIWLMEVLIQRQLLALSFSRWVIHMLIFWGFIALGVLSLFLVLLLLAEISGVDGGLRAYFLYGSGQALVKVWGDFFGLCLLLGLLAASFRRVVNKSRQQLNDQSDFILLAYLIWLALSGFLLEGLRLSHAPASISHYSFVGRFFALPWAVNSPYISLWLTLLWSIHAFSGLGLLLYLPKSKLVHSFFGPVVIALNASEEKERNDIYWPKVKDHRPIK